MSSQRTFDHLYVVGYEADIVLDLQTGMTSFFKDQATGTL